MRLRKEQVEKISKKIIGKLKSKGLVTFKIPEPKVLQRVIEFFLGDLIAEDRLNDEVKDLMEKYKDQIESGTIDYQKMFNMIKKQLVKDRKLVI